MGKYRVAFVPRNATMTTIHRRGSHGMPDMSPSEPQGLERKGRKSFIERGYPMAEEKKVDQTDVGTETGTKKAKMPKKKKFIIVGVVAVVLVAAGAGFMVWHEQPTFCNAICHTPMDAYVDTYVDGSTDAYGNELASDQEKNSMMAYMHGKYKLANCLDCHVPTIGEQVTEGMHWITGNYEVLGQNKVGDTILAERSTDDLVKARNLDSGNEFCSNSKCHSGSGDHGTMTRDELVALTAGLSDTRNPHLAQHGEVACSECHNAHSQSVNACSQCHSDAPIPDGWLSVSDYAAKTKL